MHAKTRRSTCRLLFAALCVVPTLAVLGVALYRASPLFASRERLKWQRAIEDRLGLCATIQRVSYPRGGVTLLTGVTLFDPDSQQRLLGVRLVEVAGADGAAALVLSQPEVEPGRFLRLWEAFHDRVLRAGASVVPARLTAHEVTLRDGAPFLTFTRVRCAIEPTADVIGASIEFEAAGIPMPAPARIEILRNRRLSPPTTAWELNTGPTPLPCSLFAAYCAPLARLGADCRFQGTVIAEQSTRGWNGELAGEFHNIDLARLLEPFPHKLSGAAHLLATRIALRNGRLSEAAGSLDARRGVASQSLLARFAQAFPLAVAPRNAAQGDALREYDRLAVGFQLDGRGMRLRGLCEGETAGVLVADQQGPLVVETEPTPVPAMALAQALAPEISVLVPATAETNALLQALPLPRPGVDAARVAERPGYTPLRLRGQ